MRNNLTHVRKHTRKGRAPSVHKLVRLQDNLAMKGRTASEDSMGGVTIKDRKGNETYLQPHEAREIAREAGALDEWSNIDLPRLMGHLDNGGYFDAENYSKTKADFQAQRTRKWKPPKNQPGWKADLEA